MRDYPKDNEFKEIVEDYLGRNKTQRFLRENKNFMVCASKTSSVADISRRIMFGYRETIELKEGTVRDHSTKATGFKFDSSISKEELIGELNEAKRTNDVFDSKNKTHVHDIRDTDEGIEVTIGYQHTRPGQMELLNKRNKTTEIRIEENELEETQTVNQDYETVDEFNAAKSFFRNWAASLENSTDHEIDQITVSLDRLPLEMKIELFDEILGYKADKWRLDDVTGIEIKRDEQTEEVEDEMLQGISEAALSGNDLRTNSTVQKCENEGYYFTGIRLLYQHKSEAKKIEIKISFKENPRDAFDIEIKKEYEIIDDVAKTATFDDSFVEDVRDDFRSMILEIYTGFYRELQEEE